MAPRPVLLSNATEDTWANQMHLNTQALPADFPIEDVSSYLNKLHAGELRREPRPRINPSRSPLR